MAAFTLRSSFVVAAFLAIVGIFLKQTANFYEDEKGYDTDRAYSFSLGHVALYLAALTTIPVNKTGIIVTLFRIPFDRATKFHRFCGALTMIMVVVHAIQIVGFWGSSEVIQFDTTRKVGVAYPAYGLLGACCFGAMALTSPFPMRSRFYELFQLIHSLFLPALVFIILHVPKHDKRVLVFSLLFFALDWLLRAYQGILSVQNVSISSPYSKYTVLKVRAEHIKNVEPGQFCYVNVAAASIFQWHPISICSYDRETQEVTFVIKNVGDWTAKICDVVNSASMDSLVGDDVFRVRLCGPYGRIRYNVGADKEKNLYQYSNLVLVAGGIGCTPMISTLQWLIDNANDRGNEHGIHVTFLISARDHEMFSLFAEYFKKFNDSKVFQKGGMDLRLYCTTDQRSGSEVASMQNALEIQTLHTSEVVPFFASSVANLSVPITHGRPDLGKEIETVCACRESDKSKVCVLVCGPAGIVTAVQKGCYAAVKKFGPVLDLHEESFRI
jgi:predicted ferric reductase